MMDEIRVYLLQVVAAAIVCSIVASLCDTGRFSPIIRMILGVVMVISVLRPIVNIDITRLSLDLESITEQGSVITAQADEAANSALADLVSEKTGEYIENKAHLLGSTVTTHVEVEDGIPVSVTVEGDVSPYIRSQLSAWIATEIGIKREAQNWS